VAKERKPKGWSAFDVLARKLAAVPKEAADKAISKTPKRKRAKKANREPE
jgi:hypothetical protein